MSQATKPRGAWAVFRAMMMENDADAPPHQILDRLMKEHPHADRDCMTCSDVTFHQPMS